MIVLDTNVLSELMRGRPDERVLEWVNAQPSNELWLTTITVAEILLGVALLPDGRRKARSLELATEMFSEDFEGRFLSFDAEAAFDYAALVASRERRGRRISMADAQIAAICLRHEATLATRNLRDFADSGVELVDPWGGAT